MNNFDISNAENNKNYVSGISINLNGGAPLMDGIVGTAARWGITEYHARQLALSGKVKAVRAGGKGKILVNQQSVAEYFNNSYLTDNNPAPTDGLKPMPIKL